MNVEAKASDCGGPGPGLSQTFQIGNINPTCPTATVRYDNCGVATFTFSGTSGLSYYINTQPYNFTSSDGITPFPGATATIGSVSSPTITTRPFSANFNKGYFDVDVFVTSPCAAGSGFVSCTVAHVFVPKQVPYNCFTAGGPNTTDPSASSRPSGQLYPNPTTGTVAVQPDTPTRYQWVKVLNLQGRVLLDQKASSTTGITSFDVRDLPTGLYEVQLFDGQKLVRKQLVKE